jgi:DNA repair protein RadC
MFQIVATPVPPRASIAVDTEWLRSMKSPIATAVFILHNHPSGDPTPSAADVDLTRRLAAAGALMGVDLVDHIVLADVRYCSFKEMGQL